MGGDDGLVRQASGKVEEKEVVKDAQGEELKVNDEQVNESDKVDNKDVVVSMEFTSKPTTDIDEDTLAKLNLADDNEALVSDCEPQDTPLIRNEASSKPKTQEVVLTHFSKDLPKGL